MSPVCFRHCLLQTRDSRGRDSLYHHLLAHFWGGGDTKSVRAAQRIDSAAAPDGAGEALQRLSESWPAPRASKFYKLRLWNVLEDSIASPRKAVPLLPLLTSLPTTREAGPSDDLL